MELRAAGAGRPFRAQARAWVLQLCVTCLVVGTTSGALTVHAQAADEAIGAQTPAAAASTPLAAAGGASQLATELAEARAERDDTSRLLPGLLLGVGAGGVVFGAGVGIGYVQSCDGSTCSVPAWVAISVVSGALLGALGTVWLVNTNHDLSQLDMKIHMLEQEIDRYRVRSALERRELALRSPTELTLLRGSF